MIKSDVKVYLSLGGNLNNSLSAIKEAFDFLTHHPKISDLKWSHFYRTSPVNVDADVWFVNTVCSFNTTLSLNDLFSFTQLVEKTLGKKPKPKNSSRLIDIDILFFGSTSHEDQSLQIPHPQWKNRLFVLKPLLDLTKNIEVISLNQKKTIYDLDSLLQFFNKETNQVVSLLEENPDIQ